MKGRKRLHLIAAAFTLAVLLFLWYLGSGETINRESGAFPFRFGGKEEEDLYFTSLDAEAQSVKDPEALLWVYVSGAVNAPGVYYFHEGDRAFVAVEKAGGFSEDADRDAVNLALPLKDGEQLKIPRLKEDAGAESPEDGRVNINTAGIEELTRLSGIGEAKAKAIIAYRTRNGPFESPEDLKNVSGIGASIYQNIAEEICTE